MYPNTPTHTEELTKIINDNTPLEKDTIKKYIDEFDTSKMNEGDDYYFKRNKITTRPIYKYTKEGAKVIDHEATNNKLASGWHKLLVDQKAGYLVGDTVTIGYKGDTDIQPLIDLVGDDFHDALPQLVKNASNRGKEWLHRYITPEGDLDFIVVAAQEFIPIYDNSKHKRLEGGIRFYSLDHDDIIKVELWDSKQVTYYEMINGQIHLDANEEENPAPHFKYGEQGYSWEKTPFVEFKNNDEAISDLTFYKDFIDVYDRLMSDSANTLEEIQEFLYVIRGYEGTDMDEAVTNLKRYKGAAVSGEGGIEILQGEMPMQSLNSYLDRLKDDIFQFGQAVDVNADKFGNSPSGIALKFLFSLLDMKANVMERKFTRALKEFMWFVTEYASMTGVGDYDPNQITFTFNKSMLMNDAEQVQILMNSPELSIKTKLENHPMVSDPDNEMKRREEDMQNSVDLDEGLEDDE